MGKNVEHFTNLHFILEPGAMLSFSVVPTLVYVPAERVQSSVSVTG